MRQGLSSVKAALHTKKISDIEAYEWRQSVVLAGKVRSWDEYLCAGYAAVGKGYKGVVNDVVVDNLLEDTICLPPTKDLDLAGKQFDVVVIGGGVIGAAISRELTRWNISVALLEKEEDLAKHASSRNNGLIHPGFAPSPGSKKAQFNSDGNQLYTKVADELGVKFKRPGLLLLLPQKWLKVLLPLFSRRARKNNVPGIKYLNKREVLSLEPNVTSQQQGGIFFPSAGIISPYKLTLAYAENAIYNGASIFLNTAVTGFKKINNSITEIKTNRGNIKANVVINAAGIWADKIAQQAGDRFFTIHPRQGTIAVLDKKTAGRQQMILAMFQEHIRSYGKSKGGGLAPTTGGNLLIGPSVVEQPGRENYATSPHDLDFLFSHHLSLNASLKPADIITYFAGTRACTFEEDFIIEPSEYVSNLIHVAGIQSPGLASAPAIAVEVEKMTLAILRQTQEIKPRSSFQPRRKAAPKLSELSLEEKTRLIRENPSYGRIICRCEAISEGEVVAALHSPLPAPTLDGLKRRVRTGMGRCQGAFCTPRVLDIFAHEKSLPITAIQRKGPGSEVIRQRTKGDMGGYKNDHCKTTK